MSAEGWGEFDRLMDERVLVVWNEYGIAQQTFFGCLGAGGCDDVPEDAGVGVLDCKGSLSLRVLRGKGASEGTARVMLHVPVKSSLRAKDSKDMYVILPVSTLGWTMATVNADAVADDTCRHLFPATSYTRITFSFEEDTLFTVMPKHKRRGGQIGKLVGVTARRLIMNLMALCNAPAWEVYLADGACMTDEVRQLLDAGVSAPPIQLRNFYGAGVAGAINKWEDYPYRTPAPPEPPKATPPPDYSGDIVEDDEEYIGWKSDASPGFLVRMGLKRPAEGSPSNEGAATNKNPRLEIDHTGDEAPQQAPASTVEFSTLKQQQALAAVQAPEGLLPPILFHDEAGNALEPSHQPSPPQSSQATSHASLDDNDNETTNNPAAAAITTGTTPPPPSPSFPCHTNAGPTLYHNLIYLLLYLTRRVPFTTALTTHARALRILAHHVNTATAPAFRTARHRLYRALNNRFPNPVGTPKPPAPAPPTTSADFDALLHWLDDDVDELAYPFVDRQFARVLRGVLVKDAPECGAELQVYRVEFCAAALCVGDLMRRGVGKGRVGLVCGACVVELGRAWEEFE